jgi:hypothetical protein
VLENSETCFGFTFCGVPIEKIARLCGMVDGVMADLGSGQRKLDLTRMTTIVKNQILRIMNQVRGVRGRRGRKGGGV